MIQHRRFRQKNKYCSSSFALFSHSSDRRSIPVMSGSSIPAVTFSILMPVYNHAAYVGEAVASVRAQDREDWELIVVDDGSTDGSAGVAEEAAGGDGRIRILRQSNAGPAAARNLAAAEARGAWLAFLDSDDVWYPHALAAYGEAIAADPAADFFHGYRHRMDADGAVTELAGQF
jgi:glycosyltransferase involved in cell wall biosynthesis